MEGYVSFLTEASKNRAPPSAPTHACVRLLQRKARKEHVRGHCERVGRCRLQEMQRNFPSGDFHLGILQRTFSIARHQEFCEGERSRFSFFGTLIMARQRFASLTEKIADTRTDWQWNFRDILHMLTNCFPWNSYTRWGMFKSPDLHKYHLPTLLVLATKELCLHHNTCLFHSKHVLLRNSTYGSQSKGWYRAFCIADDVQRNSFSNLVNTWIRHNELYPKSGTFQLRKFDSRSARTCSTPYTVPQMKRHAWYGNFWAVS